MGKTDTTNRKVTRQQSKRTERVLSKREEKSEMIERERIQQIYDYLVMYIEKHGYVPSLREIAEGVGFTSAASVQKYLDIMKEKNIIASDAGKKCSRAFRLTGYKLMKQDKPRRK